MQNRHSCFKVRPALVGALSALLCGCHTLLVVGIRFPEGSFKRPDVAIFCQAPDEELPSVELIRKAVVEVLSKGYEAKDLQIGLPFYLA